jgi:hypothetical protein
MTQLRRGTDNQAVGLIPLLLFTVMDYYYSYTLSFVVALAFCVVSYLVFRYLRKGEVYQFMLLPVVVTFLLYSIFLFAQLDSILSEYSALILEILLVIVLSFVTLLRKFILRKIRYIGFHHDKQTSVNASLNEFFYIAQITQYLYSGHLFCVMFYLLLPDDMKNLDLAPFFFQHLEIIIGVFIIAYEHIRLYMIRKYLRQEVWLPVLNESGKVIGRIARSISIASMRKFYHPVVRIVLLHKGMLYLAKRSEEEIVSPEKLDYPFKQYVKYKQSLEDTASEAIQPYIENKAVNPRFMVRYTFEDSVVKHLVAVFVVNVPSEDFLIHEKMPKGKLWTAKQIEENIGTGLFSDYFEKEFSYLKNTVLLAESFLSKEADVNIELSE